MREQLRQPTLNAVRAFEAAARKGSLKAAAAALGYDSPAPLPRQHNKEIYGDLLGLDPVEIERLAKAGVI